MTGDRTPGHKRMSTGIAGLDAVLGGGVPSGSIMLLAGEPGTGKTVLALQMVFEGARRGQRAAYFTTLSEPSLRLIRHMQGFRFFDVEQLEQRVSIVDIGGALRAGDPRAAIAMIAERVEKEEPELVVVDSFKVFAESSDVRLASRMTTYDLAVQLASWSATTLLVGEYSGTDLGTLPEFAVADGIVWLGSRAQDLSKVHVLEVRKLRGSTFVPGVHFFEITDRGLDFFPRVRAPEQAEPPGPSDHEAAVPTGVVQLDALLSGGLPRSSTTTIIGGSGTGKTVLGLQFLADGARRGEPGVLLTLEETPQQIRAMARAFPYRFAELERDGLLHIRYTAPIEVLTDKFLQVARTEIERLRIRRVVLDSLTSLSLGTASGRRYRQLVYAFAKHMRALGVTPLLTIESPELLGSGKLWGRGFSFASDNLIHLRFVERGGRLDRAVSVIKARGVPVNTELRGMSIGPGGVEVSDRNPFGGGVLTGVPEQWGREGGA